MKRRAAPSNNSNGGFGSAFNTALQHPVEQVKRKEPEKINGESMVKSTPYKNTGEQSASAARKQDRFFHRTALCPSDRAENFPLPRVNSKDPDTKNRIPEESGPQVDKIRDHRTF